MRKIPNYLHEAGALQYRPARWVQTIATDFFSRKFFPLENERAQTSEGTKCCTARSGRAPADDRHVKRFHRVFNFVCHVERSRDISDSPDQIQRFLDFARNDRRTVATANLVWRAIQ